jgi:CubicO group peptidase (beta-lactamase class C family)
MRHGHIIAEGWWEPFHRQDVHLLHSLSKSFTSSAIGLAVDEGRLDLDDRIVGFFPDDLPSNVSPNLAAMRIWDLLTMSTGHDVDTTPAIRTCGDGNWAKAFLAAAVPFQPGTHFLYNSGATYMLSAILQKVTGMTTLEYLRPRLLNPLGIEKVTWETCPKGYSVGGWGMSITTESIARFGQMLLQKGRWQGKQILPESWVNLATSKQVENGTDPNNDWNQGYGFQFWRCRHNAFRGDGAFGQFCIVMPEQDMVVAMTGANGMGPVLEAVWNYLLPAVSDGPVPEDEATYQQLRSHLVSLRIDGVVGEASTPLANKVSGRHYRGDGTFQSAWFDFGNDDCVVTLENREGTHQIHIGESEWIPGSTDLDGKPRRVAAKGAWTGPNQFTAVIKNLEAAQATTMSVVFQDDRADLTSEIQWSLIGGEGPTFSGKISQD